MAMNGGLQQRMLLQAVERAGIDPQAVDAEALIDTTLSLPENLANLERQLGIRLSIKGEEAAYASHSAMEAEWNAQALEAWAESNNPAHANPEPVPPVPPSPPERDPGPLGAPVEADPVPPPSNPSVASDPKGEGVRQAVWSLTESDPKMRALLERAVAWEDAATGDAANPWKMRLGWEALEIQTDNRTAQRLVTALVARLGYKSSNAKHYFLCDRDATRYALSTGREASAQSVEVPRDTLAEFEEIAASGQVLERLAPLVAPHVHGLEAVKRAILLQLASCDDEGVSRARINLLMYGPPGTAKTDFLYWVAEVTGCEVWSPRMSASGLTVDMRSGEPGALPRAHGTEWRTVATDELEKTDPQALRQLLMALEEGEFSYVAAGIHGTMKAEVRFIGAANEIDNFSPELLDRMDFLLHVPLPSRDQGRGIIQAVTLQFMRPGQARQTGYIRDYLRWARTHRPEFNDAERDLAGRMLAMLVDLQSDEHVRVRGYQAILRVAYALARLERGDVTGERVLRAVGILNPGLAPGKMGALRTLIQRAGRSQ